jgi:acetyl esterase
MAPNPLVIFRILSPLVHIKLLNLVSRFPPLPGGKLDEQTALLQKARACLDPLPLGAVPPPQSRREYNNNFALLKAMGGLFEPVHSTRDLTIPSPAGPIPARLYIPGPGSAYALFILFHGGGFVLGGLESGDNMARFICKRAGCAVLSVDYRLAPEHPFPAAVEDAYASAQWASEHAAELNADPTRLLVGGDSAGATLSAVVSQLSLQRNGPPIAGQVLFYPSTDSVSLDTPSFRDFGQQPLGLTRADIDWFLDQYLPDRSMRADPAASPMLADDLHGLPPTLLVTAEFDVLRDEGEAYARCLQAAGVPVRLMRCSGMIHGFLSLVGLVKRSTVYFNSACTEIRRMAYQPVLQPEPA